jgi:glycerol-3-phosphate dehydrogenase
MRVVEIIRETGMTLTKKDIFNPNRKGIIIKKDLPQEEVNRRTALESCPEKIICRCERVTEGEIVDALNRNIDISSIDAVKRRTRAGMGLCQGNFCGSRVRQLIAREKNISEEAITNSPGSVDNFDRVKNFYKLVKRQKNK